MVRVGVTGATGFIAGALVPGLRREGHEPVLVDNGSGPLHIAPEGTAVLESDFASPEALEAMTTVDVVLHLGAVSGVVACAQHPSESSRVNVAGTRRLVEWAAGRRIPVVFASSFAVVGRPDQLPITETTPARPTHEYARQKAEGEKIVASLAEGRGPTAVVLRMSNVYGRYRHRGQIVEKGNVLTVFARQAGEGRLTVNAPGTQRRNFVHIDDVVAHWTAAVAWVAGHPEAGARTFSVASTESYSVLELAGEVVRIWRETRGDASAPVAAVVPNPRAGVELIDAEFAVDRTVTERDLGVRCSRTVDATLRELLALPSAPVR